MPRSDLGDEGTALICPALLCPALILQAVVAVECLNQDMMETGSSSRHLWNFRQEELKGAPSPPYCGPLETSWEI